MGISINTASFNFTAKIPGLVVSSNGRFLQTTSGTPVFVCGFSSQMIMNRLNLTDINTYLDQVVSYGYNGLLIEMMSRLVDYSPGGLAPPATVDGILPFTKNVSGGTYDGTAGTADFSTPNETYWQRVDAVYNLMAGKNIIALTYPMSWGFNGMGAEGWWQDMTLSQNTRSVHNTFGQFLGARYNATKFPNIWWLNGSDYNGSTTGSPESGIGRAYSLMQGIITGGGTQLRSGDWQAPSESSDAPSDGSQAFENYIQLNGTYSTGGTHPTLATDGQVYLEARRGWNYTPIDAHQGNGVSVPSAIPCYGKEYNFKGDTQGATDTTIRKENGWGVLSGNTAGFWYGNIPLLQITTGWQSVFASDASVNQAGIFANLIRSLSSWQLLVPSELSGMRRLITTSNGLQSAGAAYVAAAQSSDGHLMLCYVPPNGSGTQSFSVDFRSMAGTSTGRWWDPTTGTFTAIGTFANSLSAQNFTTPGNNNSGDNDWVLVLQS